MKKTLVVLVAQPLNSFNYNKWEFNRKYNKKWNIIFWNLLSIQNENLNKKFTTKGHGKKAFFIDPNLKGSQWFDDIKNIKEYRIGSYELLKKIVKNRTKLSKVSRNHKDFYCLESDDTSKKIANYLMQKASEK